MILNFRTRISGVTYVKFTKMSEAARAVEEMNGVAINENTRPLKVIIANRYYQYLFYNSFWRILF